MQALLHALQATAPLLKIFAILLVVLFFASGLQRVGPEETGVLYRFGKQQPKLYGSGLVFTFPTPVDRLVRVPTSSVLELRLEDWAIPTNRGTRAEVSADPERFTTTIADTLHPVSDGYTLTGDTNIVRGTFVTRYKITDPIAYLKHDANRDAFVKNLLYRSLAHRLANMPVDDALTSGLESLRKTALDQCQERLDALHMGITLDALEIVSLGPAKQVKDAFEEVVSAQVQAKALVEDAKGYRSSQLPLVQGEASKMRMGASAAAADLLADAKGEAAAFSDLVVEYHRHPELVKVRMLTDNYETILQRINSSSVLPLKGGLQNFLIQPSPRP